ncbi:hypothetical protein OC844_003499 [Tilletia horrida]|nr:hypothetical protein OC844_003499 [Tilletia horrida]
MMAAPRPGSSSSAAPAASSPAQQQKEPLSARGDLYIVHFTASNLSFRIPDWEATCTALGIEYAFVPTPHSLHTQVLDNKGKKKLQDVAGAPDEELEEEGSVYDPYLMKDTPPDWHAPETACSPTTDARLISPFHLVYLPSDAAARAICARSTQVKSIYAYWAAGRSYVHAHVLLKTQARSLAKWRRFDAEAGSTEAAQLSSWRASFVSINQRLGGRAQVERIDSFSFFDFRGPIDLKRAEREWVVVEEHSFVENQAESQARIMEGNLALRAAAGSSSGSPSTSTSTSTSGPSAAAERSDTGKGKKSTFLQVFVGRLIAHGSARELITTMDLKKRVYIGNTSMPAEQSLLMATMALAKPGKIVYDPFAGTGSILYACAQYGAYVVGSDIDARMMKGKDVETKGNTGMTRAASQYGLQNLVLDGLGADMTQHPWRRGGLFDAIVADPPYGIRAGAKRLGRRNIAKQREEPFAFPDGSLAHQLLDYIAPTRPYHLLDLTRDLLDFAHFLLVRGGRLVFWLPCVNEDDGEEVEIPQREGMRLVARSTQDFGRWSRMLITLEKVSDAGVAEGDGRIGRYAEYGKPVVGVDAVEEDEDEAEQETHAASASVSASASTSTTDPAAREGSSSSSSTGGNAGRYLATADANEFRNRVYAPKGTRA